MQTDRRMRVANQIRLQALAESHGSEVRLICSHDPTELRAYQAPVASPATQRSRR